MKGYEYLLRFLHEEGFRKNDEENFAEFNLQMQQNSD